MSQGSESIGIFCASLAYGLASEVISTTEEGEKSLPKKSVNNLAVGTNDFISLP